MDMTTCAFTGHRPHIFPWKDHEDDLRCIALKRVLTEQITAFSTAGVTDFLSGMAEGTDQYCSQIILDLRKKVPMLKLHCVLPHEGQANGWSDSAQERYHAILRQADSVKYVSRDYYDGCMIARNHRLVESAGFLLAVYNGARRSGTGATVSFARRMGREVIVIDPITRLVTHESSIVNSKQEGVRL